MLHQIGVGALGPVFRTYDPERDRLVAVKVFRLDIPPEQSQSLADELSRAVEAGLFHPSIVEPIAAGVEGSTAYRAEEYVAAESLDVAMRHYAPAPLATVLPFITQLAGAIDFARASGVGHGALHPRDIFVTPEEARATGFGVVEALERVGFRAPIRRPYSPPERIEGRPWTTTADVFSLAAITYELLTGRRPAGLGREIGPLTSGTPNDWMDALHAVLARAMDADPAARFATALTFAAALESAERGQRDGAPVIKPVAAVDLPPEGGSHPSGVVPSGVVGIHQAEAPVQLPQPPAPGSPEPGDDIEDERFEDEAHQDLMIADAAASAGARQPDLQLEEDIEAEAEADRFVGDDFLIEAAGAASAPAHDTLANPADDDPLDLRALDDDEVMVDEPPSPLFQPEDLLHEPPAAAETAHRADRVDRVVAAPIVVPPVTRESVVYSPASEIAAPPEQGSGWFRTVAFLIVGLLAGLAGGYAIWGGSTPPPAASTASTTKPAASAGREFSEQAVTPPAAPPASGAPPPAAAPNSTAARGASPSTASTAKPAAASPAPPAARTVKPPAAATTPATAGSLAVRSTPNGAGVTVNGEWRGRTPLTITGLPLARYDVRVVQPGFVASREVVTLSPGEPTRALSFRLQQQAASPARSAPAAAAPAPRTPPAAASSPQTFTGSLYVDSRPRGAQVSIDGKPYGVTPLRIPDVRIGTHVVRLELPDHRIWSTTATVTASQEGRVTGSLERIQ